ncbi:MAG: hypothetical protein ACOCXE_01090 [Spirochaetota bacterium]
MEDLFRLILALFVLTFPLLSIVSRQRRARAARRRRAAEEGAPAGAPGAQGGREAHGVHEAQGGREAHGGPGAQKGDLAPETSAGSGGGSGVGGGRAAGRTGESSDPTRRYEISRGRAREEARGKTPARRAEAALDRLERLPRMQRAVIWAEILGPPKGAQGGQHGAGRPA